MAASIGTLSAACNIVGSDEAVGAVPGLSWRTATWQVAGGIGAETLECRCEADVVEHRGPEVERELACAAKRTHH